MLTYIAKQFRKPTGFCGKIISKMMTKGNVPAYDIVIPELHIKPKDRILEIGYGLGIGIDRISSDYDCFVSGIDFSEIMFRGASKRNKDHIRNKKAELCYGDFLTFNMVECQYDIVFCLNVIYFWDSLDEPFSKIKALLKEGGTFCIYMLPREDLAKAKFTTDEVFNKYTIDQVSDQLKLSGFKDISYQLNRGYIIKCRK
ncbi:MAG: class I SAM-dependent methyltransferase [Bacteroidales bacterium]|nr:class I SAM-dependent methyltransferase [Bacteroidales bacterium]